MRFSQRSQRRNSEPWLLVPLCGFEKRRIRQKLHLKEKKRTLNDKKTALRKNKGSYTFYTARSPVLIVIIIIIILVVITYYKVRSMLHGVSEEVVMVKRNMEENIDQGKMK